MSAVARFPSPKKKDRRKVQQQLIKELIKVWTGKDVEENYQNYYLTYLDSLPDHLVEIQISREIKKTLENKSHYFNINKSLALHSTSIARLRLAIDKLQKVARLSSTDIEYLCELLDELRTNNILVAENTLNFNYESSSKSNSQFGFVHGNNYIFERINSAHEFIKTSFLRKYIVFTQSYDPFFLYHYETAKTTKDLKYKSHPSVQKLFDVSISKAYKIMKLQQEILEFLSGKVPTDRARPKHKTKRYNYSIVNDHNLYKTTIQQTSAENLSTNRLENHPYVSKSKQETKEKDETMQSFYRQRSNTEGDVISRYFNSGIGPNQNEKDERRNQLPKLQRRQSYNSTSSPQKGGDSRRQRIHSIGNEVEGIIPVTLKNSQLNKDSLYIIKKRKKQFKSQLPLRYAKPGPVNEQMLQLQQAQINQMRGATFSRNQQRQDPLENKSYLNPNNVFNRESSLIEVEQFLKKSQNNLKNFKLKAGNLSLYSLFIFLRELNIQQRYRKMFQTQNWEHSIRNNQYYLHKFYINQVMMAISLCCALPECDVVIKYWGPTTECGNQMSQFLFQKYLEHIQRQTICRAVFFNANPITQVLNSGFQLYKERIYRRQRSLPCQVEYYTYYPFLQLGFSSIVIPRSTNKDLQQKIIVLSNACQSFSQKDFYCFNYLLIINKLINPGQFSAVGSYSANLKNMKEVQTQMIKKELFFNPYNLQSTVNPINLLTLKMKNPILSAFFVSQRPYIKLVGNQIYSDEESLVVSLKLLKCNTVLYFGKGFRSIGEMVTVLKNKPGTFKPIEYCVRMFSKRMRGKIQSINLRDEICFGDFDVVFEWKDFLKGKIEHNFEELEMFGEKQEGFYCLLEIDKENIFVFQVDSNNFI